MERSVNEKAEQKKQLGNNEFKKANYTAAINYYTDALGKQIELLPPSKGSDRASLTQTKTTADSDHAAFQAAAANYSTSIHPQLEKAQKEVNSIRCLFFP